MKVDWSSGFAEEPGISVQLSSFALAFEASECCDRTLVEVIEGEIPVTAANEAAVRQAFESAGIEFTDENGTGEGVRFRKPRRATRK